MDRCIPKYNLRAPLDTLGNQPFTDIQAHTGGHMSVRQAGQLTRAPVWSPTVKPSLSSSESLCLWFQRDGQKTVPVLLTHDTNSSPFQVCMTSMSVWHGKSCAGSYKLCLVRALSSKLGSSAGQGDLIFFF